MELPDRLKETADEVDEDVVPQQGGQQMFMNMNQSIFGLIAAAGSTAHFNDRFEEHSSDEDEAVDDPSDGGKGKSRDKQREDITKSQILKKSSSDKADKKHRRRISTQLLQSLPQLPRLSTKSRSKISKLKSPPLNVETPELPAVDSHKDDSAEPTSPDIEITVADRDGRTAPVMSRMLEARAEMVARPSFDLERRSGDVGRGGDASTSNDTELAMRLKEIFEFDQPEKVLEGKSTCPLDEWHAILTGVEYPCWLLQSVLLQGYMYITTKHICFYAYLPKKAVSWACTLA
jgi:sterol 3beta-glucosyltransferase